MTGGDAFVGRRVAIERVLVCAHAGQFPVLARDALDELAIVVRSGDAHYGLGGTLATACSRDGGRTWSAPIAIAPGGDDIRNPAFAIARDGRWLLAYWQAGVHGYPRDDASGERAWRLPAPDDAPDRVPDLFVVTSDDRGRTWSPPRAQRSALLAWASPYGRMVVCADGTLLMAAYGPLRAARDPKRFAAIVLRSTDGGATWGDDTLVLADASELALCALAPGVLLGAVRRAAGDTAIVRSRDGGRTWSAPIAATREHEHPADLCVLRARGRVLLTFGRRVRPLGCGALTSADGGVTWDRDHEVLLAGDGVGNDVGYPSTVQLTDGTLVTALYFARGSGAAEAADWGETSCQALRYPEAVLLAQNA